MEWSRYNRLFQSERFGGFLLQRALEYDNGARRGALPRARRVAGPRRAGEHGGARTSPSPPTRVPRSAAREQDARRSGRGGASAARPPLRAPRPLLRQFAPRAHHLPDPEVQLPLPLLLRSEPGRRRHDDARDRRAPGRLHRELRGRAQPLAGLVRRRARPGLGGDRGRDGARPGSRARVRGRRPRDQRLPPRRGEDRPPQRSPDHLDPDHPRRPPGGTRRAPRLAGGAPTYARILKNVAALMESPSEGACAIRVNLDKHNLEGFLELRASSSRASPARSSASTQGR